MTRIDDMLTVNELKALRKNVDDDEFEYRVRLHCNELFDLNSNGFFDGFEFIGSELHECSDSMQYVIVYTCRTCDGLYEYDDITVSFDGSVMYGICSHKIMSIFRKARFGDKFVTDNGTVLIYGKRTESVDNREYGKVTRVAHILMGCDGIYHVSDEGNYINYDGHIEFKVVGRLSDDDLDVIKVYVKKELCDKEVGGYMQGFVDGYKSCVID